MTRLHLTRRGAGAKPRLPQMHSQPERRAWSLLPRELWPWVADISHGVNGGRIVPGTETTPDLLRPGNADGPSFPPSSVTLDPAWSPTDRTLAFVDAARPEHAAGRKAC